MLSLTRFKVRFTPRWQMSLLALFFIFLFSRLGFWQLQRAVEKKQMLSAHRDFAKQAPIIWDLHSQLPAQYQPIAVRGHFLPNVLLLDNQFHQHKFGYHVISPLLLANQHVVLVDRGWIVSDVTRQTLPAIPFQGDSIDVVGTVYYPSEKNWLLGQLIEQKKENLAIVELIDTKLLGHFLHKSVYPFIIRLGQHEANGYVREWAIVAMPPQRHYAYALQWFAMALVILILFIALNIERKK